MRAAQPRLSEIDLWAVHVEHCMRVLRRALALLCANAPDEPLNETILNRELYWCVAQANREFADEGFPALSPIIPEACNPPAATDAERTARENKIPDFMWGLTDNHALDLRESVKHFVIECKCLFALRRKDWIYTEQYVVAGVRRFIDDTFGYGKGMSHGAMVGYLQTLTIDDAREAVNTVAGRHRVPDLDLLARDGEESADLDHNLERNFEVSPFYLRHLWARMPDLPTTAF